MISVICFKQNLSLSTALIALAVFSIVKCSVIYYIIIQLCVDLSVWRPAATPIYSPSGTLGKQNCKWH